MSRFICQGDSFYVYNDKAMDLREKLPANNYTIKKDPQSGALYLQQVESFTLPSRIYGKSNSHAERIMSTFDSRSCSTGVLLNGEKGSGKTLLAKRLSILGAEKGYPTILINAPWSGDAFNQLIQNITQEAIILFDEFEKVYPDEEQAEILTLLDGVYTTKKLFVLTCNNKYAINDFMRNRPGRLFYMIDYSGLDVEFIREYCEAELNDKSQIDNICNISALFTQFNFDILKALVEEMNRYNEPATEALKLLNAKPGYAGGIDADRYDFTLVVDGVPIDKEHIRNNAFIEGMPIGRTIRLSYALPANQDVPIGTDSWGDLCNARWVDIFHSDKHLQSVDAINKKFVFNVPEANAVITYVKRKEETGHIWNTMAF